MSDLSRLRRELASSEQSGRRVKRQLEFLRSEIETQPRGVNREQEREIKRLEDSLTFWRKRWAALHARLAAEEKRLVDNPAGFLRFT